VQAAKQDCKAPPGNDEVHDVIICIPIKPSRIFTVKLNKPVNLARNLWFIKPVIP